MNEKTSFKNWFKGSLWQEFILPLILSIIAGTAFSKFLSLTTTNIFSLIFLFLLFPVFKSALKLKNTKLKRVAFICGALYTLSFVLVSLSGLLDNERPLYALYVGVCYAVGFFTFFGSFISLIFNRLLNTDFKKNNQPAVMSLKKRTGIYVLVMAILLLCWLPYFLKSFPGYLTADSRNQLIQIIGTASYSNWHPIAHTMIIKLFYNLGMLLFNDNQTMAIATYNLCQAILLSAAFSFLIVTMCKFNVKTPVVVGSVLFYAIIPYHGVYSVTMWKDVWFGGIVVVLSTVLWRLIRHFKSGAKSAPIMELIMLFIFGLAMCLFRSNGLYAYIVLTIILCIMFFKKSLPTVIIAAVIVPLAFIIRGPVYSAFGVTPADNIESLAMPIQHISRAISDGAELTDEQYELLSNVLDVDKIAYAYSPHMVDPIKNLIWEKDNLEYITDHKLEFLELWVNLGLKNPKSYLLAQIEGTFGYWYPDVQYWIYAGENVDSADGYQLERQNLLSESLSNSYDTYLESYKDISYWGLFWSIGTASWLSAFMFFLCRIKRSKSYLVVYVPVLAVMLTLLVAAPVYSEFRYTYSMFASMPLLCVIPFCHSEEAAKQDDILNDCSDSNATEDNSDINISFGELI